MARLSRIAPEIPVSNLQRSLEYYQQNLGFRVTLQMPSGDYAVVERDDIAIHLFHDGSQDHSPAGIHIFTQDLEALHTELQQRRASVAQGIVRQPWGNRDFRVHDDSGNLIKFTEPLAENK